MAIGPQPREPSEEIPDDEPIEVIFENEPREDSRDHKSEGEADLAQDPKEDV